jgi:hypothetical protein
VNDAVYENIDDVVAFVKWLDDELGFLVSIFVHNMFSMKLCHVKTYCIIVASLSITEL